MAKLLYLGAAGLAAGFLAGPNAAGGSVMALGGTALFLGITSSLVNRKSGL